MVYPRFTRAVAPRFGQDKMHPNEAYAIVRENEDRDNLIINDVIKFMDKTSAKIAMEELTMMLLYLSRFTEGDRFSDGNDLYAWKG